MKKKTGILVVAFLVFYSMIHLGWYLPDLYNGKFSLVDERSYDVRLASQMVDVILSFLFVWSTYHALYIFYPVRKYLLLAVALIAAFITCFIISFIGSRWFSVEHIRVSQFFRGQILYSAFYVVFAMVFYFVQYAQFKELRERELAVQNRDSSLAFLRSQINPHFLFNNLNNIYSLVYHQSDQSLAAISGLSELLRYILYDTSETISLEKDVHYLEKYIELEQLRFEKPCKLNFNYTSASLVQLPPFLLIPFIENAFKHGAISFDHVWLDISISNTPNHEVIFRCINDIGVKHKDHVGGIGIENVRKRLELLYPGNHRLDIEDGGNTFKVELKLGAYENR